MAKVKIGKKDTFIDMTAMSDVTVLLLTFFMLTANFIPLEPVQVITPSSVIETKVPDFNFVTILVDPEGRVYLNLDRKEDKRAALERMGSMYEVSFSEQEKAAFAEPTTFASVPMKAMQQYLRMDMSERKEFIRQFEGIPADSLNNQLASWIKSAKAVNPELTISVKADEGTPYPLIRKVTATLQEVKENRFSLVTQLRGMPDGL